MKIQYDQKCDTFNAYDQLGLPTDQRTFTLATGILQTEGIRSIRLLTNSDKRVHALQQLGVQTVKEPLLLPKTEIRAFVDLMVRAGRLDDLQTLVQHLQAKQQNDEELSSEIRAILDAVNSSSR